MSALQLVNNQINHKIFSKCFLFCFKFFLQLPLCISSAADFPLFWSISARNALFCRQNPRLKIAYSARNSTGRIYLSLLFEDEKGRVKFVTWIKCAGNLLIYAKHVQASTSNDVTTPKEACRCPFDSIANPLCFEHKLAILKWELERHG